MLNQEPAARAARSGVELQLELDYSYVGIRAYRKGNVLQVEGEPYDYSGWADVFFMGGLLLQHLLVHPVISKEINLEIPDKISPHNGVHSQVQRHRTEPTGDKTAG